MSFQPSDSKIFNITASLMIMMKIKLRDMGHSVVMIYFLDNLIPKHIKKIAVRHTQYE